MLPEGLSCEKCTLQFIWETPEGTFYSCADLTLKSESLSRCLGKCKNGGACVNGKCSCLEPFSGEFCAQQSTCPIFLL